MILNYKQLAFILDIEPVVALEKIIAVHCKLKDCSKPAKGDKVSDYKYPDSPWPLEMDVGLLELHLNLPTLQQAVEDIKNNYLKRAATKRYILLDFPEKELKIKLKSKIKVPPVLASLLKPEDVETIENEWARRYGIGTVKV